MASITAKDVRLLSISGEFDALTDEVIDAVIADVNLQVNLSVCADLGPLLCKNLAAHMIVMRSRTGLVSAGPVAGESAGGVSRSYRTSGTIDKSEGNAYFMQTSYGQEFLRLSRIIPGTPLALNTRFGFIYDSVP